MHQNGFPTAIWPYFPLSEAYALPAEAGAASQPEVIVMAGPHVAAPENPTPRAPADYSYIAGCRAIPNGYHCDTTLDGARP